MNYRRAPRNEKRNKEVGKKIGEGRKTTAAAKSCIG